MLQTRGEKENLLILAMAVGKRYKLLTRSCGKYITCPRELDWWTSWYYGILQFNSAWFIPRGEKKGAQGALDEVELLHSIQSWIPTCPNRPLNLSYYWSLRLALWSRQLPGVHPQSNAPKGPIPPPISSLLRQQHASTAPHQPQSSVGSVIVLCSVVSSTRSWWVPPSITPLESFQCLIPPQLGAAPKRERVLIFAHNTPQIWPSHKYRCNKESTKFVQAPLTRKETDEFANTRVVGFILVACKFRLIIGWAGVWFWCLSHYY